MRTATSGVAGTKLSFLASDHHGTSSIALEAGTYAVTKRYTSPFGNTRGSKATSWPDDKTFLGAPADESTGLTHIGAREYDPVTGQFTSVDPLLELNKHQTLNGYSYAVQNPLTHSDPTGMGLACNGYGDSTPCPTNPSGGRSGQPDRINGGGGGGGGNSGKSGTAAASSGPYYSCTGTGPAEICRPLSGPEDSSTNSGNFLSSLLGNPDFWSGVFQTIGGSAFGGLSLSLAGAGAIECGTGILCVAGAPQIAVGVAGAAVGYSWAKSGSDKLGQAFREADEASTGQPTTGQVGYGSTDLSRSVQLTRLINKDKVGNYAAARLDDGTIVIGRSGQIHAEEDIIYNQAKGRKIVDMYSEREPCKAKCLDLTKDMNVTYTVPWNGATKAEQDAIRAASNRELKRLIKDLFDSP
ncbi:hypothetical protein GCM10010254_75740 [Streptomyces chromofuscus]|nr:hypothetical protein GCM10010254_75740 [Streptomyces chromofuscus]